MKVVTLHQTKELRGIAWTVPEFARVMNVTANKIREFIVDGMPVYEGGGRGKSNILSSADCIQWLRERGIGKPGPKSTKEPDENNPKQQMELLKLEEAKIDLAVRTGELVPMAAVEPAIKSIAVELRTGALEVVKAIREEHGEEIAADLEVRLRALFRYTEARVAELGKPPAGE